MSNPFGAFTPSTEPQEPVVLDAEFEEVTKEPPPVIQEMLPPKDEDTVLDVEAALDDEVTAYRQQLGLISPIMLSKILGVHQDTLKSWRSDGRGPNYLKIGKRVWYNYEHVQDWLPTCKVRSEEKVDDTKEGLQQNERAEGTEPEQSGAGTTG
jgi:hypothetical protein